MTDRVSEAFAYASALHREQRRKGSGSPYLCHLMGVAGLVMEGGGDEEECIAALLHDAVEDQGGPPVAAEIRRRFGGRVADIVMACTEDKWAGLTWRERKQASVEAVPRMDRSALLVLTADKLHNVRALVSELRKDGSAAWDRFRGGREGTAWYYRAMAGAIESAGGSPLSDDLAAAVDALEAAAAD